MIVPVARIGSSAEPTTVDLAKPGVKSMAHTLPRIETMPDVRVPELAAATGLNIKDIYRVLKKRRADAEKTALKGRRGNDGLKLRATEAVAVAASLSAAPKLAIDRAMMSSLFVDYLLSSQAERLVRVDTDLYVDAAEVTTKVAELINAFNDKNALVEIDPAVCGGDPVYRGTSISIHNIAKRLTLGDTVEDIQEDLPSLSHEAILAAPQLAAAHPLRGRPRQTPRSASAAGLTLDELMIALKNKSNRNASKN
jgi:uncharacterized protein (DUF433 family)